MWILLGLAVLIVDVSEIPEDGISLGEQVKVISRELGEPFSSVVEYSSTRAQLSGLPAYRVDVDTNQEGDLIHFAFLVSASCSRVFVLTAVIQASYVEAYLPAVEAWFESFNVLPVEAKARWHEQDVVSKRDIPTFPESLIVEKFHDVAFVNDNVGWVVGSSGSILHTSDGGVTWAEQTSNTTIELLGVTFVNAKSGWAVGRKGVVLNTNDGGNTWTSQDSGTTANLLDATFLDINEGWAVGDDGTILHSSNGGSTWTKQEARTRNALWAVTFLDRSMGWIVGGQGTILHTTDSGNTWTEQASGTTADLHDVVFLNRNIGLAVGDTGVGIDIQGVILRTTDSGLSWTPPDIGFISPLHSLDFVDDHIGWAVGPGGTIWHTGDGGLTWDQQFPPTVFASLFGVAFVDSSTGWAVGGGAFEGPFILKYCEGP